MNSSIELHSISIIIPYIDFLIPSYLSINPILSYSDSLITIEPATYYHLMLLLILISIIMLISHSFDISNMHIKSIMFITFISFSFTHEYLYTSIHKYHMLFIY